jgi:hypothetical protein
MSGSFFAEKKRRAAKSVPAFVKPSQISRIAAGAEVSLAS